MGPDDLLLIVMLSALTVYALLGGADFGAGVWEFITVLRASDKERQHIYKAIGPVWEANHVWLIFVLVILMNGFPLAFAALSRALWLPLLMALCGIVFRGASFAFRSYGQESYRERRLWEAVFAIASTATPLFLGASAGAVASGKLAITVTGFYEADYLSGWLSPLAVFSGFYMIGLCAFLAAVYLFREADQANDMELVELWRQRSLLTGIGMGGGALGGLILVWLEAPSLTGGFAARGWPLIILSIGCGIGSLIEVWRFRSRRAVVAATGAVAAVIWGWGISQYPAIIPPVITSDVAKAPDNVLWIMLAVILTGAALLLPALGYLFVLFKSRP